MSNRIEQIVENIYEFVESCRPQAFSSNKIIVPKDEFYTLLDELRLETPDEIKRYQKIIQNRDAIIKDAEGKAAAIIEEAKMNAQALVNENSIFQQACAQANQYVAEATANKERVEAAANRDAEQIRMGALAYADELLYNVEHTLALSYNAMQARSESMLAELKEKLELVIENRKSIFPEDAEPELVEEKANSEAQFEVDLSADEDLFLKNIEE